MTSAARPVWPPASASEFAEAAWHTLTPETAAARLGSSPAGLSAVEAQARLAQYGPNLLRPAKPIAALRILIDQLRSVVVVLLSVAALVSWLMGDRLETAAILAVLVINTVLGFVTEYRARRAMAALLHLQVPRALVVRDDAVQEVDAAALVPGDVIALEAGRAVPADARLLSASELRTSEAALTGESLPVDKHAEAELAVDESLAERSTMVYLGTAGVAGSGRAVVVATGMDTEVGRIGRLVGGIQEERTPLERRLDQLGRALVWVALGVAALVVALGLLRGQPLLRMVQTGIALAIAAVPEGLPAVVTIALAVGVARMARRHALVRRLPAVESLGSVTLICTDKTGTLTAGEMTATVFRVDEREIEVSGAGYTPEGGFALRGEPVDALGDPVLAWALRIAGLTNRAELLHEDGSWTIRGDPTEAALLVAAHKAGQDRTALCAAWPEIAELPFSSERMWMATFHRGPEAVYALVKGAPGRVVERCVRRLTPGGEVSLDAAGREQLLEQNRTLAARGLRVLALAYGRGSSSTPGAAWEDAARELVFVALVGMADPPAPGVKETIAQLRQAGIRTVMITGDQRRTAEAVARELGVLLEGEGTLDGSELHRIPDADRAAGLDRVAVLSRISPEDKLRIVSDFQQRGHIVAMLGDGVNDAAALKKADVGVAMGMRGTDVAKEAAAVVLQDDRFQTVAAAVEQGRVIFDNIRKFVFYLFSCNLAEVGVILVASLVGLPQPLQPLQILWLNLLTDTFPALSLAMEPGEPDLMRRPPQDPRTAILSSRFLRSIVVHALAITFVTLAAFVWTSVGMAAGPERARTVAFVTLAFAQIFHLGNARSSGPVLQPRQIMRNPWALAAVGLAVALQVLAIHFAPLARVLNTVPLSLGEWITVLALSALPAVVGQAQKWLRAAYRAPGS